MKLLFLDTETNGLPANRYASYTDTNIWPHVIQLSWQLVDTDTWVVLAEQDAFIKPRASWNKDAERVHQIPESVALKFGKEPEAVLADLHRDIQLCDGIVAHNLSFDKNAILCEVQRLREAGNKMSAAEFWNSKKTQICTMVVTKRYCEIRFPNSEDYKFPKLGELYYKLFGVEYDISGASLHNAKYDVSCLVTCFRQLVKMSEFVNLLNN